MQIGKLEVSGDIKERHERMVLRRHRDAAQQAALKAQSQFLDELCGLVIEDVRKRDNSE